MANCGKLKSLTLRDCRKITDAGIAKLRADRPVISVVIDRGDDVPR